MKKKPLKIFFSVIIFSTLLCFLIYLYIPIKDNIWSTPYVAEVSPVSIDENSFSVEFQVPCNRFYEREIGFRIDPPIKIESFSKAQVAVSGKVKLKVVQNSRNKIDELLDISRTGWSATTSGVWSKVISRYPPLGSFFCDTQLITIEATNINFDLKKHDVTIYVSRDRRP